MHVYAIDHIQLALPPHQEARARAFYAGILGLRETPKPPHLAQRGGVWFAQGAVNIHLGVDHDFRPAKKAHLALLVDGLAALIQGCEQARYPVVTDEPLAGYHRVYVADPFGNRIELMERVEQAGSP